MKRILPLILMLAPGCTCAEKKSAVVDAASATAAAGAPDPEDDEVRPVYSDTKLPPDPLAERLCQALHDLPAQRAGECCKVETGLGALITKECVRNLSAALHGNAISLDPADVDRCLAAQKTLHAGCDWVGPWTPPTPKECQSILQGRLKAGAKCRSTLECAGGLRCRGVGPTDPGVCAEPFEPSSACGTSVDTLAAYTRQDSLEATHPECKGFCVRHRCRGPVELGEACDLNLECGPDRHCKDGKCAEGATAKVGESCTGGGCEPGARCALRTCVKPSPAGAACTSSFECAGACLAQDGGGAGVCGMGCDLRQFVPPEKAELKKK